MRKLANVLEFVDFKDICYNCKINCCRRFYAVLLPEEEETFKKCSEEILTDFGAIKTLGSPNSVCPYLNKDNLCEIYSKRPFDCRIWPVVMYYDLKTDERVIYLDLDCEAVKENKIPKEIVEKIVEILKNIQISDLWLKKYTLAPWPNNFVEIARYKSSSERD